MLANELRGNHKYFYLRKNLEIPFKNGPNRGLVKVSLKKSIDLKCGENP